MQRHDRVATIHIRERLHIVARLFVHLTIPRITSTRIIREIRVICGENRQMQRHYTITACRIGKRLYIVAGFLVNLIIPRIVPTSCFCEFCVVRRANVQRKNDRAVATVLS